MGKITKCLSCQHKINVFPKPSLKNPSLNELFATYMEVMGVEKFNSTPSWWDFNQEELPFCVSCMETINCLHNLQLELKFIQTQITQVKLNLKGKILYSQNDYLESGYRTNRDNIFRSLAVSGLSPTVQIPKLDISGHTTPSQQLYPTILKHEDDPLEFLYQSTDAGSHPIFDDSNDEQFSDQNSNSEFPGGDPTNATIQTQDQLSVQRKTSVVESDEVKMSSAHGPQGSTVISSQNSSNSLLKKLQLSRMQRRNKQKWMQKSKRDGREYIHGIELLSLESGKFKCGNCDEVLKSRKYFAPHVQFRHLGIKRPHKNYSERRKRVRASRMDPNRIPPQKWTERTRDGKVYVRGIELIDLGNGQCKCGSCGQVLNSRKYFTVHVQFLHLGLRRKGMDGKAKKNKPPVPILKNKVTGNLTIGEIPLVEGDGFWSCGKCGHKLTKKYNMAVHIRTHLGIKPPYWRVPKKMQYGPLTYSESLKPSASVYIDGRRYVEGVEIIQNGNRGFQCGLCLKSFGYTASVIKHIKTSHMTDDKCFACEICKKKYAFKSELRRHEQVHAKERVFTCHECGVSFKTRSTLWDHSQRIHLKIVKDKCEFCGKEFYSRKDCNKHRKTHESKIN